ncbi:hypothetical protein HBN82_03605 [Pseudomonas lundensis]|uniref:hypothetical protein n=1 Tax=Pseudomonas lundensis TaxID=86185 RepID=UPI0014739CFA|nr:hypothetical protein [Pseudomonas lundensis]NNA14953.1 hypothetical protein [Pseudomonas lundensis]
MTFLLKYVQAGKPCTVIVSDIDEALSRIEQATLPVEQPTLFYEPTRTYCVLRLGLSRAEIAKELESQWEWAATDTLKTRPILKEKYRR